MSESVKGGLLSEKYKKRLGLSGFLPYSKLSSAPRFEQGYLDLKRDIKLTICAPSTDPNFLTISSESPHERYNFSAINVPLSLVEDTISDYLVRI